MRQNDIIAAVKEATIDVFTTMLADEPKPGEARFERHASGMSDGVVSLIGLTGRWIGTGMITCGAPLACRLSSLLLMAEAPSETSAVDEEVLDSMAEITNMVIGNVKNILESQFGELHLSIPTVVYGRNLTTRSQKDGEWVVVPFTVHGQCVEVKVCLTENPGKTAGRGAYSAALQHV